ncbi:hypothetical protein BH09ACT5_BH09ACT5_14260 [soil metagenome]
MSAVRAEVVAALRPWCAARPKPESDALAAALGASPNLADVWLTLAVMERALPTEAQVRAAHRLAVLQGAEALVADVVRSGRTARGGRQVELLESTVVVDVRHTAETDLATGIQRVARETVKRWDDKHEITLVTWTEDGASMRRLLPVERSTALHATPPVHGSTRVADRTIVIPVSGWYLLPELAAESWRTERVATMAAFAGLTTAVIGFDCVPLTTAETVGEKMPAAFARNLVAVANMDRVATISDAAGEEYSGWRRMLSASGNPGPDIRSILLAAEPGSSSDADESEFLRLVGAGDEPLVLVVGSHEPRKNHRAVLQAAELAWREGLEFRLVFVGGNSWNSANFSDMLIRLKAQGRMVDSVSALPDRLLWAAYRLSRFTVFTSINEGFGLPVAESLASGTPVLTSDYGSMKQIAAHGGALVVDPRDDRAILGGLRALLTDGDEYATLKKAAAGYVVRPWSDYADDLWTYFVEGADAP